MSSSRWSTTGLFASGDFEPEISDLSLLQRTTEGHHVETELLCDLLFVEADFSDDRIDHRLRGITHTFGCLSGGADEMTRRLQ